MGLDMYTYMAEKISESKAKKYAYTRWEDLPDYIFSFDEEDADDRMFRDLRPFMAKTIIINTYVDFARIRKDNNIPDDWELGGSGYGNRGVFYTFGHGHGTKYQRREISYTEEELKPYIFDREEEMYIAHMEEIGYWRKNYDLQKKFMACIWTRLKTAGFIAVALKCFVLWQMPEW